jgi:Cd2+/Zn2+-exporting ATPase
VVFFIPAAISFALLLLGIVFDNYWSIPFFENGVRVLWYGVAYVPVGFPVLKDAWKGIRRGEVFTEFLLMTIATLGAFAIGEFPEGVAVMLFYSVGEIFQTLAVKRAKSSIKKLLDQRPDKVTVVKENQVRTMPALEAKIGDVVQLKPGEKLGLDGELLSDTASFNTAALTGESKPDRKVKGDKVWAGMINLNTLVQVKVTTAYEDSKLSRILELVQNATSQKAKTELFIRRFARYYTPIVVMLAVLICLAPYLVVSEYVFRDWLYRALVFLVISCPCALVISIPLGYFGGIGAASRHGILFKGGNFLDAITEIQNVVMDKTGTLTKGVFKAQDVHIHTEFDKHEILRVVNALEGKSTHPVATAIHDFVGPPDHSITFQQVEELAGYGLKATLNGREILVGNLKLMDKFFVPYDSGLSKVVHTLIAIAYYRKFRGHINIADEV